MIDGGNALIKWSHLGYEFSNENSGRIIAKDTIEILSVPEILIWLRFERGVGNALKLHCNGMHSLGVLVMCLDFCQ